MMVIIRLMVIVAMMVVKVTMMRMVVVVTINGDHADEQPVPNI
jgi:hypothetical protein